MTANIASRRVARGMAAVIALLAYQAATAQDYPAVFAGLYDEALYPEYDYEDHPTAISSLPGAFTVIDGNAYFDYSDTRATRLDDSVGVTGGSDLNRAIGLGGDLSLALAKPRTGGTYLLGFDFSGDLSSAYELLDRYDSPTQYKLTQLYDWPLEFGLKGLVANKGKASATGYSLDYDFSYTPNSYRWVTDTSQEPLLKYADAVSNDADVISHAATLRGDWSGKLGVFAVSAAAGYRFGLDDRSRKYLAVDTDGDDLDDSVMLYKDWSALTEASGGPQYTTTQFDQKDLAFSHRVDLDVLARLDLSKKLELLLDVGYTPVDATMREYYTHVLNTQVLDDKSVNEELLLSDFGNVAAVATFRLKDAKNGLAWRYALGYARSGYALKRDGAQASGLAFYSSENPGNFPELSLGLNPVNGSIVSSGEDPSAWVTHSALVRLGLEWKPAKDVVLTSSLGLTGSVSTLYYRAFNTDTRSVWQETVSSDSIALGLSPKLCLTVPAGEKALLSFSLAPDTGSGSYARGRETAAFDLTLNRQSEDGSVDLTGSSELSLSLGLSLVIRR